MFRRPWVRFLSGTRAFSCPTLISCWSIHLSHFITELKIYHLYHYSKSVVVVVTTLIIPLRLSCNSKNCSSWTVVVCLIWQETRVRLNPRNNSSGSDYINADFVKVKMKWVTSYYVWNICLLIWKYLGDGVEFLPDFRLTCPFSTKKYFLTENENIFLKKLPFFFRARLRHYRQVKVSFFMEVTVDKKSY